MSYCSPDGLLVNGGGGSGRGVWSRWREGESCGGEPGDGREGDGDEVVGVGGDGRQEVRGGGGCGVGDERSEQGAGEFAKLKVGERDQALAVEQNGERGGLDEDSDVGCDGQAHEAVGVEEPQYIGMRGQ